MNLSRRLPPLNALRAFEAAARHLSLSRAAEELHVTPAAVSHQVKGLEDWLGLPLFRRTGKGLLLTDAGQACLPALREGFDRLAAGVESARRLVASRALTVSVPPTFGARWLVHRLDRFSDAHPDIDVRIDASTKLVDFGRDDIDVAIRYGAGRYPGLRVELLFDEAVAAVCSPALLEGPKALRTPEDLCRQTLLHVDPMAGDDSHPDWRMWLAAAGVTGCEPMRGPRFSLQGLAVQAAVDGQGVVLAGLVLLGDDIAAGRLVQPFALSVPVKFAYYVVCPESTADDPRIVAFRGWVLSEAGTTKAESSP